MTAAKRLELIDWQTYLKGEARAKCKHEYVFGRIYAMAGARIRHNRVARNILGTLHQLLKGSPCEVFGSDAKVRIRGERGFVFFYPDVLVDCDKPDDDLPYTDTPKIIVEALSKSTRRIDEGQKLDLYPTIPSLDAYLLVESEQPGVTVWRRSGTDFHRETYLEATDSIPLPEIGVSLTLAEIYAGIDWSNVENEEEDEDA